MKNSSLFIGLFLCTGIYAQEHFAGISTSEGSGILSGTMNPAELANIKDKFSINILSASAFMSNNKMGFSDLISSNNFEKALFSGDKPASIRADLEFLGPSLAYKYNNWVFALTTSAKTKTNIIDINNDLGNALVNGVLPETLQTASALLVDYNQKATATTWGEVGLSAAGKIFSSNGHTVNAGATLKLLFLGTYARLNASKFRGTLALDNNRISLTDAYSNISFAYSGQLADNFSKGSNFVDYFGNPNGFSASFGLNYQWDDNSDGKYRVNSGIAVRNLGSMTFKDDNNQSNSYEINIPDGQFLDLEQFNGDSDIQEIENKLIESGFAQITKQSTDFKVKLPATLAFYADVNVYENWFITAYTQQKLQQDYKEDQIAAQNVITFIPRYKTDKFEVFIPLNNTQISGFAAGIGARYGGFYIGSGSVITATFSNNSTHQADAYIGFRFGF